MEPFIDFGLFELLAASGIAGLAKVVYSNRWLSRIFLVVSVVAPTVLLFVTDREKARWLCAVCIGTAIVNAAVILGALQRGDVPILTLTRSRSSRTP